MNDNTAIILSRVETRRTPCIADDMASFVSRFVALPGPARILLPIWVLHTYVFSQFEFTPYLNIVSPEPGCGKTTAGDLLATLSHRATTPACGTAAVMRRLISGYQPTLILDEWDSLERSVRDACGNFLNTGFRKDGLYLIVEQGDIVPYSTFCPKAILGRSTIKLAEATRTRCIPFMIHKATGERLEKFRDYNRMEAEKLRQGCERWADAFRLRDRVSPRFPEALDGRQQDICEPLLAIADQLGKPWSDNVRYALVHLLVSQHENMQIPGKELLRAVRKYIGERKVAEFWSREFCGWANIQEEKPWSAKPLTPAKLAEMLRVYGLAPRQINRLVNGKQENRRGYMVADFEQVFKCYLATPAGSESN